MTLAVSASPPRGPHSGGTKSGAANEIRQPPMNITAPVPAAPRPLSPRDYCTLSSAIPCRVHTQKSAADANGGGETAMPGRGGDGGSRLTREWDNARRNQRGSHLVWANARRVFLSMTTSLGHMSGRGGLNLSHQDAGHPVG